MGTRQAGTVNWRKERLKQLTGSNTRRRRDRGKYHSYRSCGTVLIHSHGHMTLIAVCRHANSVGSRIQIRSASRDSQVSPKSASPSSSSPKAGLSRNSSGKIVVMLASWWEFEGGFHWKYSYCWHNLNRIRTLKCAAVIYSERACHS